jgi:23S rRNA pseudouridine1911/1915/1917 synthase
VAKNRGISEESADTSQSCQVPNLVTGGQLPAANPSQPALSFIVTPAEIGRRLDVVLAGRIDGVSRTQLARHIGEAAVTVNGKPAAPSQKMRGGEQVTWTPPAVRAVELAAEDIPLQVVFEDESLVVVDKPAGLVVHPAAGHEDGTLVNALLAHCRDLRGVGGELRPGIVHRIDKDTSGLLVIAKDDITMVALAADFKVHRIRRIYQALVVGRPAHASGRIETLYGRDPHDRKKFSIKVRTGKRAVTNWRLLESFAKASHLEAELETGRTHQVRVHLSAMGCPLLGDATYGRPPRDEELRAIGKKLGRQALHARILGFHHPKTGKWLEFDAAPPEDFMAALAALRQLG